MYFFTADEHYGHSGIIQTCKRPFKSVEEMDKTLIAQHNAVVRKGDTVIHGGDFSWNKSSEEVKARYISRLNGSHIFLRGNHDRWLGDDAHEIITEKIDGQLIIICHYAMRVWHGSHHNSWQLYGHSHGRLEPAGKQCDIGVDAHDFYPVSMKKICEIMKERSDNPDLIAQ